MEDINDGITPELISEILANVKLLENIEDTSKDELISTKCF